MSKLLIKLLSAASILYMLYKLYHVHMHDREALLR